MEYNNELMKLIEKRSHNMRSMNPRHIYYKLWEHWPQINSQTKLLGTTWHEVNVAKLNKAAVPRLSWHNKKGRKARFWRAVGELFNRRDWVQRGKEQGLHLQVEPVFRDVVQLERFGVHDIFSSFEIECGYHAASDTLYIRDYVRPLTEEDKQKQAEFEAALVELSNRLQGK